MGLGVSFGPFDAMGRVTGYYKEQCARNGWQPEPEGAHFMRLNGTSTALSPTFGPRARRKSAPSRIASRPSGKRPLTRYERFKAFLDMGKCIARAVNCKRRLLGISMLCL
jgi:hypothetical protein